MGTSTPWGIADYSKKIASGIMSYGTPSHGGIHLSPKRQKEMPPVLLIESGWYEEDCDWCLVAIAFPVLFKDEYKHAVDTVKNWHPDRYEKYFGRTLKPGESYIKDIRMFEEQNRENFVGMAAWGDWHESVPKGMVGVCARRKSDGKERYFLVSEHEYKERGTFAFVIDENRHKEIDTI